MPIRKTRFKTSGSRAMAMRIHHAAANREPVHQGEKTWVDQGIVFKNIS